jgi:dockerin type I repeat protein
VRGPTIGGWQQRAWPGRASITAALLGVALALPGAARAGSLALAWDPVAASDLDGYRVFIGSSPGSGDQAIVDVGNVTGATLTGLPDCAVLYLGVKAVDRAGNESPSFASFVSGMTQPRVTNATPSHLRQGAESITMRLTGASFTPGMTRSDVVFDDDEVRVLDLQVLSCNQIELEVSVGPFLANPGDPGYNGAGGQVEQVAPAAVGLTVAEVSAPDGLGGAVLGSASLLSVDQEPTLTDVDGSGTVDGYDLARLGRAFGSDQGLTGWDANVDFNGDESIDGLDLTVFANWFGQVF